MDLYSFSPYVRHVRISPLNGMTPAYVDPDYVFTYIKDGTAIFLLENQKYSVKSGDVVFMPPYMRHIITPHKRLNQYILHFDLYYSPDRKGKIEARDDMDYSTFTELEGYPENSLVSMPNVVSLGPEARKELEQNFFKLRNVHSLKTYGYELKIKSIMLDILLIYLQKIDQKTIAEKHPKAWRNVNKAISYIHENYMHPLDIEEVSEHAGLTMNYFCNIFKECTNTTLHNYINAVRIQTAKQLMEDSELNFTEISDRIGFSSIHVFSKVFKKLEGISPSGYIAGLRN